MSSGAITAKDPASSPSDIVEHLHPSVERAALLHALAQRFPPDPTLGPVELHEDPCAPLDEDDWPAELRP